MKFFNFRFFHDYVGTPTDPIFTPRNIFDFVHEFIEIFPDFDSFFEYYMWKVATHLIFFLPPFQQYTALPAVWYAESEPFLPIILQKVNLSSLSYCRKWTFPPFHISESEPFLPFILQKVKIDVELLHMYEAEIFFPYFPQCFAYHIRKVSQNLQIFMQNHGKNRNYFMGRI